MFLDNTSLLVTLEVLMRLATSNSDPDNPYPEDIHLICILSVPTLIYRSGSSYFGDRICIGWVFPLSFHLIKTFYLDTYIFFEMFGIT